MTYKTEQEAFWAGDFGDAYTDRNSQAFIASNVALFSKILGRTGPVGSIAEFGANVGNNLRAIKALMPDAKLAAVEINAKAVAELRKITPRSRVRSSTTSRDAPSTSSSSRAC